MKDITELIANMKNSRNNYSPENEISFLDHKVKQMMKIRTILENHITLQGLKSLEFVMTRMYFSGDLAERFPRVYAYERALIQEISKQYKKLINPAKPIKNEDIF
ncbi:MAG: hypothetical protein Q8L27_01895 [archaeon]|nr:hypothetical protein [archaeon]